MIKFLTLSAELLSESTARTLSSRVRAVVALTKPRVVSLIVFTAIIGMMLATPGMELLSDILQIFENYDFDCEVLAASLRHPMHVVEAAKMGAHIGTMPMSVFRSLLKHPLTDIGLARFLADWEKAKKEMGEKAH